MMPLTIASPATVVATITTSVTASAAPSSLNGIMQAQGTLNHQGCNDLATVAGNLMNSVNSTIDSHIISNNLHVAPISTSSGVTSVMNALPFKTLPASSGQPSVRSFLQYYLNNKSYY
ncbi:unnamed protein product [Protopolystoma xenopodis]|uniref:Uncharacterized protein n=1 Tax=Protopolystoma xenopodis TaxID=117903 RepID=A0A448X5D7_9PLAT|nr:unnamed protein product [Protopolystoma xenopodis]